MRKTTKRYTAGMALMLAGLTCSLTGCASAKPVDFQKYFDYRIHGFSGDGLLLSDALGRITADDFADVADHSDANNTEFLNNVTYHASKEKGIRNGDEITITVDCNEELAKKAHLKAENTTFTFVVSGLTELADDASEVSDDLNSLQTENEKALRDLLSEEIAFPANKTDQFPSSCYVDASTLELQGSALVYLTESDGIVDRYNSNFVSLYTAKFSSTWDKIDGQYCYLVAWMPQSMENGGFDAGCLVTEGGIEFERASNVDQEIFGIKTEELNTTSAQAAARAGKKLDDEMTESVIELLYPQRKSGVSLCRTSDSSRISKAQLEDQFGQTASEQDAIAEDVYFESGTEVVTLEELTILNSDSLGAATFGERLPENSRVTIYEILAKPENTYTYGEIYGRIGDDQWIRLEDKKYYYALPVSAYESLIRKDSALKKAHEGVSPYSYPTSGSSSTAAAESSSSDFTVVHQGKREENTGDDASYSEEPSQSIPEQTPEPDMAARPETPAAADEGLSGPSETYIMNSSHQYVYSYDEPNFYGLSVRLNKYTNGSEVQVYATKDVDFQGTWGQIGKNEWILLYSDEEQNWVRQ